jgi:hypothetical protein
MQLSVVIASIESSRSIESCLSRLAEACAGLRAEFIVVDASRDDSAARAKRLPGPIHVLSLPPGTVAPKLWAAGYRRASGQAVAFTTGQCLPYAGWGAALLEALNAGAAGAGGPLILATDTGPIAWSVFYLRYAGSMPHTLGTGRIREHIAGDNAAYARSVLDRHAATFDRGFWEVDFHHLLRADGGWLVAVPAAVVEFTRSLPFWTIFRHRFVHGCAFGASRVADHSRAPWQIVLPAPVVPFILAARAGMKAAGGPKPWRFVLALPWFLLLASAWAAGEAWGALTGDPFRHPDIPSC